MTNTIAALIVAAGESMRMGMEMPKPYLSLGGMPVLRRAALAFLEHPLVGRVQVVIRPEHAALYEEAVRGLGLPPPAHGGAARQESVLNGLEALAAQAPDKVLIHDAARPLVSTALIGRVVEALETHAAAVPGLPVADTLRRVHANGRHEAVAREGLFCTQTPQGFDFSAILSLHRRFAGTNATDDAALAERAGIPVEMVAGEARNFKLTSREHVRDMNQILEKTSETRVGTGFDVHPLKFHPPGTPSSQQHLTLCGIRIPSEYRLAGHSDADAGLHALVDALLGAIGAGDIGEHFPPEDPQWSGADSGRFLIHAYRLLKSKGGEIINLDLTLICEQPRISPYRDVMAKHVADMLKLGPSRVNIKATTTEKLGFLGRGEGIAAQAVASVRLPVAHG